MQTFSAATFFDRDHFQNYFSKHLARVTQAASASRSLFLCAALTAS